ncbi:MULTISPECIES: hypothetical protein [unclassified Mesorhizobium]|uniref:hypothetical protein n=1 Tax=unclassified Mesorhizobium TaxID=325217 RepID=UPI0003CF817C|nr:MULTISPECIES: hypothetical protein [unclassified Mesorhizobium]ESY58235.1 hypothetical protein X745_00010 [Mesorhizobium sp. LNJC374B00]ESY60652.1 hypothetical protein X744_06735 [Mesorhizobium sp. LNJC372A00]WJI84402.1 hypothetical protein NLY34_18015 [Mesorhizobium sp. C374B]WJI90460.1 hypothetical protein NLY42_20415 [Mesorhizobium sp. C372A]
MSNRNRFTDAALGVVVGVGIALLFLVWAFPGFRNPAYQQDGYQNSQNSETGKNNPVIRPSLWETYTSPTDTYAQWVAALSALFGIGVSTWAVWLVRSTLSANTDANRISRESTEAQLRAYLIVEEVSAEYVLYDDGTAAAVHLKVILRNGGATPAIQIGQTISVTEAAVGKPANTRAVITFDGQTHRAIDLGPNMPLTILDQEIPIQNFQEYRHNKKINCSIRCSVGYMVVVSPELRYLEANFWVRSRSVPTGFNISRSGPQRST